MTKLDLIEAIGDIITEIDIARGSMLPSDPNRHQLDDYRLLLDDRQRKLTESVFNEDTPQFKTAAQQVQKINAQLTGTIKKLTDLQNTLTKIKEFLDSISGLLALAVPLVL